MWAELEAVNRFRLSGLSWDEVAVEMGGLRACDGNDCRNAANRFKLPCLRPGDSPDESVVRLADAGLSDAEIAGRLDISERTVGKVRKRHGRARLIVRLKEEARRRAAGGSGDSGNG